MSASEDMFVQVELNEQNMIQVLRYSADPMEVSYGEIKTH